MIYISSLLDFQTDDNWLLINSLNQITQYQLRFDTDLIIGGTLVRPQKVSL